MFGNGMMKMRDFLQCDATPARDRHCRNDFNFGEDRDLVQKMDDQ